MSDAARGALETPNGKHRGLQELCRYPLISAIAERRTRRVARGVSIEAGPLSHQSANDPAPLSKLEEAVLIAATGVTGLIHHDGPLFTVKGTKELGTPFTNVTGRAASSPDNAQATTFFMLNDEGVWLLKPLTGKKALDLMRGLPPNRGDWAEADWIAFADAVKVKIYDERLEFPRQFPYYHVWNKQLSNVPGTTIFLPLVDCTRGFINIMLNLLSEPDGERPTFVDDWQKFRPKSATEFGAWVASGLGLLDQKILYQPAGGIKWARSGFTNPEIVAPIGLGHAWRLDYEAILLLQNLMLIGQAMGLGAWIHATIFAPYIFERDRAAGKLGLGFRMHKPNKKWSQWPPVPAPLPNPVGLDGVLEALCPPYVASMNEVVDRFLEEKYGEQGAYGDKKTFAAAYRSPEQAQAFLDTAEPFSKKAIEYVKDVCNYIYDTYGRFPAHVDAWHLPGVQVQLSRIELEYYEKTFRPEQFARQREHEAMWGTPAPDADG